MSGNDFAICHIPHTGGTTLNSLMSDVFSPEEVSYVHIDGLVSVNVSGIPRILHGHIDISVINTVFPGRHLITFLRDPVDRTISAFNYISRNKNHPQHTYLKSKIHNISEFLWDPILRDNVWNLQTRMIGYDYDVKDIFDNLQNKSLNPQDALELIMEKRSVFHERLEESLLVAIARLHQISFFGVMDYYEESINGFFSLFQIVPRSELPRDNGSGPGQITRMQLSDEELFQIKVFNAYDMVLYEHSKKIFEKRFLRR